MACRVGITRRPEYRRRYWAARSKNMWNWRLEGPFPSKRSARLHEESEAARHGCALTMTPFGPEYGNWYVFHFEYDEAEVSIESVESTTLPLHVVDLAFALSAADYVEHEDLQAGTSYDELEEAGTERDSNLVMVSPELGRYAFHLVRRFQSAHTPTDRRSIKAHAVCSSIREDFIIARLPAPG